MAHFVPTVTTASAANTADLFFREVFRLHGIPRKIISDRDVRFTSNFWLALFQHLGTRLGMSTAFHPQTDGTTERVNRTLEQMLRNYVGIKQDDWDLYLAPLEFAYNNAPQSSTKHSPFMLNYGQDPLLPASLATPQSCPVPAVENLTKDLSHLIRVAKDNILEAQLRQKKYADQGRRELSFEVGEEVWLSTRYLSQSVLKNLPSRKLSGNFIGPFKITAIVSPVAYQLELTGKTKIYNVFHVSLLKKHQPSPPSFPDREDPPAPSPELIDGSLEYEVEAIVNHRDIKTRNGKFRREYLVYWKGYPPEDATFEPASNLKNAQEALKTYEDSLKEGRM
jgi:hypothetical protein